MKLFLNAKGQTNTYVPIGGLLLVVVVVIGIWYYNEHKNDITIHPPHIEVH